MKSTVNILYKLYLDDFIFLDIEINDQGIDKGVKISSVFVRELCLLSIVKFALRD